MSSIPRIPTLSLPTEAPDFTLTTVGGEEVSLSQFAGEKHVVLVFNRGFSCPFCRRHMASLRRDYNRFATRGAEIVVVGPEKPANFARHWHRDLYPFVGLPDPNHTVADLFGQQVNHLRLGRMPTVVLIDRAGRVRYQHHGRSMQDICSNRTLLFLIDQLNDEQGRPTWRL